MAQTAPPARRAAWNAASDGWQADARETAPNGDLKGAASFLNGVGMRSVLVQAGLSMVFNGIAGDIVGNVGRGVLGGIF
jgi:hypothetical protein